MLTPQPILLHLKDRLRQNYVDEALWTDSDILGIFNDAYEDACAQSQCLQALHTVPIVNNVHEYALPADFDQLILVAAGGTQLQPLPLPLAQADWIPDGKIAGYYLFGTPQAMTFGVVPTPTEDAQTVVTVLYSALPAPFATFGDALDPRFPIEFSDILVHYARWRVQLMSGGAERIPTAQVDRSIYDKRITELRRANNVVGTHSSPARLTHVSDRRRVVGSASGQNR